MFIFALELFDSLLPTKVSGSLHLHLEEAAGEVLLGCASSLSHGAYSGKVEWDVE